MWSKKLSFISGILNSPNEQIFSTILWRLKQSQSLIFISIRPPGVFSEISHSTNPYPIISITLAYFRKLGDYVSSVDSRLLSPPVVVYSSNMSKSELFSSWFYATVVCTTGDGLLIMTFLVEPLLFQIYLLTQLASCELWLFMFLDIGIISFSLLSSARSLIIATYLRVSASSIIDNVQSLLTSLQHSSCALIDDPQEALLQLF